MLRRVAAMVVGLGLVVGCQNFPITPGKLLCSKQGSCPAPLVCDTVMDRCVSPDAAVNGSAGSGSGGGSGGLGVAGTGAAVGAGGGVDADGGAGAAAAGPGTDGTDAAIDQTVPTCASGEHLCPVGCVKNDSPQTCGASCSPCLDPANGGSAPCDGTRCGGACPAGKKLCLGACIDLGALCAGTCPDGTHPCGQSCPRATDVNACGASCDPCPVPANAVSATCDGRACAFDCKPGFHSCGKVCAADGDVEMCGGACAVCPTDPNGLPVCAGGGCALQCNSAFHLCGNKCVSNKDVGSCGSSSCTACPTVAGGTTTCDGQRCGGTCPGGQLLCNGACILSNQVCVGACPTRTHNCGGVCVDDGSTNSCGALCSACPKPAGANQTTCDGASCDFSCAQGYHRCGAACASNDDATACGSSCTRCPTDANCVATCQQNGTCALSCNTGYHACGTKCVSNKDVNNCGALTCGAACTAPVGGTVSCDGVGCVASCTNANQYVCNGTCIDNNLACNGACQGANHNCNGFCRANDVMHCGPSCQTCVVPASNGQATCNGTTCGTSCTAGFRNCAGTSLCVSGTAPACCSSSECAVGPVGTAGVCANNVCTYPCNTPTYKQCGGECILASGCCTNSDCPANKPVCNGGACAGRPNGQVCSGGAECASASCVDGVCCDLACAGQCQACDVNGSVGTCKPVTGTPHRTAQPVRPLCGGDPACTGQCNGSTTAKCTYPANACRSRSCSSNILISSAVCDANGVCPTTVANMCPDAAPVCDAGGLQCVKAATGKGCSLDAGCEGGHCGGGVCCQPGLACNGACDSGACDSSGACVHRPARSLCGTIPASRSGDADVQMICDSVGRCSGPSVLCESTPGSGTSCLLTSSQACCGASAGAGIACVIPSSCDEAPPFTVECRGVNDCPLTEVCCARRGADAPRLLYCASTCAADEMRACLTPSDCPLGQTCTASGLGSFNVCQQ